MHVAFATTRIADNHCDKNTHEFEEKRLSPRVRTLDISEIVIGANKNGISCLVHDISEHGAKLELSMMDVPDRFILANHAKRTKTICRVVWRNNNFLGVKFLSRPRPFTINDNA